MPSEHDLFVPVTGSLTRMLVIQFGFLPFPNDALRTPCSRLMPCDLDDACRALKPAIQENFPAAARLLADQVFLPVRCSTTFRPRAVQARPAPS